LVLIDRDHPSRIAPPLPLAKGAREQQARHERYGQPSAGENCHPPRRHLWPPPVMTTLPPGWPLSRYRIASGASMSGNVLSISGVTLPASISSPNVRKSA